MSVFITSPMLQKSKVAGATNFSRKHETGSDRQNFDHQVQKQQNVRYHGGEADSVDRGLGASKTAALLLARCLFNRVNQQMREKWLPQKRDTSCLHSLFARRLIIEGGDEYNWKLGPGSDELALQFDAGHPAQMNIDHKAVRLR